MIRVYGESPGQTRHPPTPIPDTNPTPTLDALTPLLEELRLLREEVRELRNSLRLIEHKPEPNPQSKKAPSEMHANEKAPATWGNLLSSLDN
ncbi:hypothetical protein D3C86_1564320 [compost metagenome]